jgi:hypothetical protein
MHSIGSSIQAFVVVSFAAALPLAAGAEEPVFPAVLLPFPALDAASGDVDQDGDVDLVLASVPGLRLFLNDGDGNFEAAGSTSGPTLIDVVLADVDGDGKPEAIGRPLGSLVVFPGLGAGGFGAPSVLITASNIGAPRSGDFNEDGYADVAAGDGGANGPLRVWFGGVAGLATPPATITGGSGGGLVAVADLNGDQHLDLIDCGNGVNVRLGDGNGQFVLTAAPPAAIVTELAVFDADHDGKPDVLSSELFAGAAIKFRKGDGAGGLAGAVSLQNFPGSYRAFDVDGDGRQDLVGTTTSNPGKVRIDLAIGPAQFAPPIHLPAAKQIHRVWPIDVDDDGAIDLAVRTASGIEVLRGLDAAAFEVPESVAMGVVASAVVGDVNGDGRADLVAVRDPPAILVSLGQSGGGFGRTQTGALLPGFVPRDIDLADLDLDGDLDAAAATASQFDVLHGDGLGAFVRVQTPSMTLAGNARVAFGDANLDGRPDLAMLGAAGVSHVVGVAFGQPGGLVGPPVVTSQANGSSAGVGLRFADLDGNGAFDTFAVLAGAGHVALATGGGTFHPAQVLSVAGAEFRASAEGDLDGDGLVDLVFVDALGGGGIRAFLASASGYSAGALAPFGLTGLTPGDIVLRDLDGDLALDAACLASFASGTGSLATFRGDGAGGFAAPRFHVTGLDPAASVLRSSDSDFDGRPDLITAVAASGAVAVVRNRLPEFFDHFGAGCLGSGGRTPRLRLAGTAVQGGVVSLSITNALGGAVASLFTGLEPASVPLPGGCPLLAFPLLPIVFALPLSGTGPGAGEFAFGGVLPPVVSPGSQFVFQAFVADAGGVFGFAATNGVVLSAQ